MKRKLIKYLVGITLITTVFFYLKHRHKQALINQQITPTDEDFCWENDSQDSIHIITDSLELKGEEEK